MESVNMISSTLQGYLTAMLAKTKAASGDASTSSAGATSSFAAALASNIVDTVNTSSKATDASSCENSESSKISISNSDDLAGMDISTYARYLNDMTSDLISQNDLDGDGYLSASDTTKLAMPAEDFTGIDTDSDGKLSAGELNEVRAKMDIPRMTENLISSNDKSGEGILSASDSSMPTSDIEAIDTDKDGNLSSDELNTAAYSMLTKTLAALQSATSTAAKSASLDIVT